MNIGIAIGFAFSSGIVAACSSAPDSSPATRGTAQLEKAPPTFIDGKGQRWTRVRPGPITTTPRPPVNGSDPPGRKVPEDLTREELAEKLRPISLYEGYEYTLESSEAVLAIADAALRMRGQIIDYPANTGSAPTRQVDETRVGTVVFGTDDRSQIRANTDYPYRTQVFIHGPDGTGVDCAGTMIGASTMITAAHCLSDGYNWYTIRGWSPGVDSQDAQPFPYWPWDSYPSPFHNEMVVGCYWNSIPSGWWGSGSNVDYDFATIEFSYTCGGVYPGNTLGWLGWGSQYDSWIDDNAHYLFGYPGGTSGGSCGFGITGCIGGSCNHPRIWGMGDWSADAYSTTVHHYIDTQPGDSGAGIYNYVQGFPKVIAIHKGCLDNFFWQTNYGRRITSSTISFIQATTAL